MPVITLTTDLGLKDYYAAAVKAAILSQCPDAVIVDISHNIAKFDIVQTAFAVSNVHRDFPADTIHIIGVDVSEKNEHIAVFYKGQYFIGADNGFFSLLFDRKPDQIVSLNIKTENENFLLKDIYVKAACHIARGGKLEVIGKPKKNVFQRMTFQPVLAENSIRGSVIYIDGFGNVITNISRQLFREAGKGRNFNIFYRTGKISAIYSNYNQVPQGERVTMFNSAGLLEIAINAGNASELLGIKQNDVVRIDFGD